MSLLEHGVKGPEQPKTPEVSEQRDVRPPREIGISRAEAMVAPREIGGPDVSSALPREIDGQEKTHVDFKTSESNYVNQPLETHECFDGLIPNKEAGLRRESEVKQDLEDRYPSSKGYDIVPEAYLRNKDGTIARDPETGEGRRIDFIVVKDTKVIDSVEVTSETADKSVQTAKEERIKDIGGVFIKNNNGDLCEIPKDLDTRIDRRK